MAKTKRIWKTQLTEEQFNLVNSLFASNKPLCKYEIFRHNDKNLLIIIYKSYKLLLLTIGSDKALDFIQKTKINLIPPQKIRISKIEQEIFYTNYHIGLPQLISTTIRYLSTKIINDGKTLVFIYGYKRKMRGFINLLDLQVLLEISDIKKLINQKVDIKGTITRNGWIDIKDIKFGKLVP